MSSCSSCMWGRVIQILVLVPVTFMITVEMRGRVGRVLVRMIRPYRGTTTSRAAASATDQVGQRIPVSIWQEDFRTSCIRATATLPPSPCSATFLSAVTRFFVTSSAATMYWDLMRAPSNCECDSIRGATVHGSAFPSNAVNCGLIPQFTALGGKVSTAVHRVGRKPYNYWCRDAVLRDHT